MTAHIRPQAIGNRQQQNQQQQQNQEQQDTAREILRSASNYFQIENGCQECVTKRKVSSHDLRFLCVKTTQIAELLRPFIELDQKQLEQVSAYLDLLLKWNSRVNLTAVRRPEDIVTRHFGESFFAAAQLLRPEGDESIADLGSGAGFPGIPLAMFAATGKVTLIESNGKKAAFLNEVIRSLQLANATVFNGRGEDYGGSTKLVTMRAVEKFKEVLPLAAKMVAPGGRLALMIGSGQVQEAVSTQKEIRWNAPIQIPGGHSRVLLVGTKSVKVD